MSASAQALLPYDETDSLLAPSAEEWLALSPAQRATFIDEAMAAVEAERELMPESRKHFRSKSGISQVLGDFFERTGRCIYLASELAVSYPRERVFVPDLMAVHGVEDPGDNDPRTAWIVAQERKGLDFVLEISHRGDRSKDLFTNVINYARMQIPEYFIYDCRKQCVLGYRLPSPGAVRYQPIPTRGGRLSSRVLGLDLVVIDGKLRFFYSEMEVPESKELLGRANAMLDELQRRNDEEAGARAELEQRLEQEATARIQAESARIQAESARAEAESARAEAESARAQEAIARAELEQRLEQEVTARAEAESARAALELRIAELLARAGQG